MKHYKRYVLSGLLGLTLFSTATAYGTQAFAAKNDTIATVNDSTITQADMQEFLERGFAAQGKEAPLVDTLDTATTQAIIREIAAERLLRAEIKKSKISRDKEIKKRIAALEEQVIRTEFLRRIGEKAATKKAIKQRYNKLAADLKGKKEFEISHILLTSEQEAKQVRKQLKKGKSFTTLAKTTSQDTSSAAHGGSLGYLLESALIQPIKETVSVLKKGAISSPVKTSLGWHILRLDNVRPAEALPFEQVEEQIKQNIMQEAISKHIAQLLEQATITHRL